MGRAEARVIAAHLFDVAEVASGMAVRCPRPSGWPPDHAPGDEASSRRSCKARVSRLRPFCSGNWGRKGNIQFMLSTSFYTIIPRRYREMRPLTVTQTCRVLQHWKRQNANEAVGWVSLKHSLRLEAPASAILLFEEIPNGQVRNALSTEKAEILDSSVFYVSLDVHLAYGKMRECWERGK